jgi:A/G-specific adenine glycosylase
LHCHLCLSVCCASDYSRATRLLLAAQKVVDEYAGNLPSEPRDLEKNVPGVGPYTAGAISSIVYGNNVPLVRPTSPTYHRRTASGLIRAAPSQVDGNVQRVLSRILGVYADPKSKAFNTLIWSLAKDLVEQVENGSGGCWNEGLMEVSARPLLCPPVHKRIRVTDVSHLLPSQLGATICRPTDAKCGECPVSASCVALQEVCRLDALFKNLGEPQA